MSKHCHKISAPTNTNTHSYFSDASRAVGHREENLQKKLRKIQEENALLEEKIKLEESQINSERTTVMYHLGQLTKIFKNKMKDCQEYKIVRSMFGDEEQAHELLKELMFKFQEIEKQEKMMTKVRNTMEKIFDTYIEHKRSIEQIMNESDANHKQNEQRIKNLILQKKTQFSNIQDQNAASLDEMEKMKSDILQFKQNDEALRIRQIELRKQIAKKQQEIKQKLAVFENLSKWTETVIDKKYRYELYDEIKEKRKQLSEIENNKNNIEIALKQQILKSKRQNI